MNVTELSKIREQIKKIYPHSTKFDNMPEHQLLAVYNRLKSQGKLSK